MTQSVKPCAKKRNPDAPFGALFLLFNATIRPLLKLFLKRSKYFVCLSKASSQNTRFKIILGLRLRIFWLLFVDTKSNYPYIIAYQKKKTSYTLLFRRQKSPLLVRRNSEKFRTTLSLSGVLLFLN